MDLTKLIKLANVLDGKGHIKLADTLDSILKKFAEEAPAEEEAKPTDEAAPAEEEEEAAAAESAPAAPAAPVADAPAAPADESEGGMLGDSWYGEGPQWDLTPVSQGEFAGSMLDHRQPLPTDAGGAAPVAAAPVGDAAPAEETEEGEASDDGEESEGEESEENYVYKLACLANSLDQKGHLEEADMVDSILKDLKK